METLVRAVEAAKAKDPIGYTTNANTKLLAALRTIALERIPADPTDARYRQGRTFGAEYRHWFREKFGSGRFRLFFRFDTQSKIIIYAWVNNANSLRMYGSKHDAYAVFARMLGEGHPPDDWTTLIQACTRDDVVPHATTALET